MSNSLDPNDLLTPSDAARVLGLSADSVRVLSDSGRLPAMRTVSGRRLFTARRTSTASRSSVCRKAGISEATFYNWRKKYGGLMPSEMKPLKQLEEENAKLKKIVADLSLDKEMLQDVIKRKL